MAFKKIIFWCVLVPIFVAMALTVRQMTAIFLGAKGIDDLKPFSRSNPKAGLRILFLGDSTAVGTGAKDNRLSTAGHFGRDFPDAEIVNISRNGEKIAQVLASFDGHGLKGFDLVVLQIGANDILRFTPYPEIERDLASLMGKAKRVGRHVVILHSGNVGAAPIFRWPFDCILTERTRQVRAIYMRQANELGVSYVDLFQERDSDLFLKDVPRYYAPDRLHPSGDGYRWWYERIRQTMDAAGIILN